MFTALQMACYKSVNTNVLLVCTGMTASTVTENRVGALEFYVEGEHFPGALGDRGELLFENFRQAFVPGDAKQGGARAAEAEGRAG